MVHMFVCSAVRARHTHTEGRCQNYYTRRVADEGCKKEEMTNDAHILSLCFRVMTNSKSESKLPLTPSYLKNI